MKYNSLGGSGIKVSQIGLGTMTFGEQNSEIEGHRQLDMALDYGVNFIDTAEMYSIPPKAETYGGTETIIGNWLRKTGNRERIVLASKVIGKADDWMPYVRDGRARLNRKHIVAAIDASLKRLQTDVIDLYQMHWPDRNTNFFGQLEYRHDPDPTATPIAETLSVLKDLVATGKVRCIGISNETPWGMMQYLRAGEVLDAPRIVSIQNPYNLLNRSFEVGLSECCHNEAVDLLAYSPLGFGVLTGKYLDKAPAGARLNLFPHYQRYSNDNAIAATTAYVELAREHGLSPAQMALAFVNSRPFVAVNIIGATGLQQLEENLKSSELALSDQVLDGIETIHQRNTNPSP